MFQPKHSMEQLHVQMSTHPLSNQKTVASGPVKSMGSVITKAGIFMASCIRTHASLLLPVQLLYVGKLRKTDP